MTHKKHSHQHAYMVIWVSRVEPEIRRGVLPGFYTKDQAKALAEARNVTCPHEFFWVTRPPRFKSNEDKTSV